MRKLFFLLLIIFTLIIVFILRDDRKQMINGSVTMEPAIKQGDLVTWVVPDDDHIYNSGDLVIIKSPLLEIGSKIDSDGGFWVRRIIAHEGDSVSIKNGKFFLNGKESFQDIFRKSTFANVEMSKIDVPAGKFFYLGDNLERAVDSRKLGCLDYSQIIGKVISHD